MSLLASPPLEPSVVSILGPPLRTFRVRLTYLLVGAAFGVGFTAIGLLGLARLLLLVFRGADSGTLVVQVIAVATFFLPGAIAIVWSLRRYRRVVTLCEGGLHVTDARGRGRSIAWHDVNGVTHKILRVYRPQLLGEPELVDIQDEYTLLLRNNEKVDVDYHFADVDALGQVILQRTMEALFPAMRQAFYAGQSLGFGPIAVDRYGVHVGGNALGWAEVASLTWKPGLLASDRAFLHVNRAGAWMAWAKVPVAEVVNYQVLMALARELNKAG